ncbi:hypothetical protein ROE7235_02099 [Roseibaca ekhonensis]|uniref:Uncharacterized protein n=1 Tax=Roseinatronobacter ekhonensis TaxID=254356 RepID=A0A3B0M9K7_9RHOB|nr:hypothetical protein [Roseibaca ekhonensis]SUZ32343.1 hypothetical protein ROE7235_02099 [Roseibaca ekhonensis]
MQQKHHVEAKLKAWDKPALVVFGDAATLTMQNAPGVKSDTVNTTNGGIGEGQS